MRQYSKYVVMWFALLVAALLNAGIREGIYAEWTGTAMAQQISVFTGIILTGIVAWSMLIKRPPVSVTESIFGGLIWLVMTELFEFSLIVLYSKNSLDFFFGKHNVAMGELWPVFLVWVTICPFLFYRWKNW